MEALYLNNFQPEPRQFVSVSYVYITTLWVQ